MARGTVRLLFVGVLSRQLLAFAHSLIDLSCVGSVRQWFRYTGTESSGVGAVLNASAALSPGGSLKTPSSLLSTILYHTPSWSPAMVFSSPLVRT